ncbi:MAG: hypothetical protein RLZZ524_2726, partial [Pseudomonadota bacterium]
CETPSTCRAPEQAPVILVHGFTPELFGLGGGEGTWGAFPQALIDRDHAVFEMQWMTHMRFEEAAGGLSRLIARVAEWTGKKPVVIAHSFGGIVTHLSAQGKGREYDEASDAWRVIPIDSAALIDRIVTLDSPLSGISDTVQSNVAVPTVDSALHAFTRGRQHLDTSINACASVTCMQAGAFDLNIIERTSIRLNVSRIEPALRDESLTVPSSNAVSTGESIARIQAHETPVPHLTYASLLRRPIDDWTPDITPRTVHALGDGLISLMGQAVRPQDFALRPYDLSSPQPDFQIRFLSTDAELEALEQMQVGNCLAWTSPTVPARPYRICPRSGHTTSGLAGHRLIGDDYSIAFFESDIEGSGSHPLLALMGDPAWLERSTPSVPVAERAPVRIKWRTVTQTAGAIAVPAQVTLLRSSDRRVVFRQVLDAALQQDFDVASALADSVGQTAPATPHILRLELGGSDGLAGVQLEFHNLSGTQDLADIDLTLKSGTESLTGAVIDGQTEATRVGGATIYLMKGVDQPVSQLENVVDTRRSRRVVSDAQGAFSVAGLEAGDYSLLVRKAGYLDQLQGRVLVDSGANITVSLLRVLPAGQASITLRWAAAGVPLVAGDLDAHLIRYAQTSPADSDPTLHVHYAKKTQEEAALDRDDTDHEGPETITLTPKAGPHYVYFVHQYSALGSLIGSLPRVYVQIGDTAHVFTPPVVTSDARFWRVFDLVDGQLTRCDSAARCLSDTAPAR